MEIHRTYCSVLHCVIQDIRKAHSRSSAGFNANALEVGLAAGHRADWFGQLLQMLGPRFLYLIIFAATAGYFVCFWPGHPVRRVVLPVLFPVLPGVGLMPLSIGRCSTQPKAIPALTALRVRDIN